jgi:hypothetical protein
VPLASLKSTHPTAYQHANMPSDLPSESAPSIANPFALLVDSARVFAEIAGFMERGKATARLYRPLDGNTQVKFYVAAGAQSEADAEIDADDSPVVSEVEETLPPTSDGPPSAYADLGLDDRMPSIYAELAGEQVGSDSRWG